jgi:hypothetical protein
MVSVTVEPVRVSVAEAELLVRVELDEPAVGAEVRGRLAGPRCEGVSTVEVAYPLRPAGVSDTAVSLRAVIPEPNPWTPAAPFRYEGRAELWADGQKVDERAFAVELRPAAAVRSSPPAPGC